MSLSRRIRRLLRQLEERGVLRAAGLYAAGSFVVLQVADLVLPALPLPDATYNVLVVTAIVGFIPAVAAAWLFDVTEAGLARAPAGLDAYERETPPPRRRLRVFSAAVILVLAVGAVGLLAFRSLRDADDGDRVALAVFPFTATTSPNLSEGVADLLATALDGAEAFQVLDPWALWTVLRDERGAAADVPDPARASLIARDRGAHRYVLGSVVELGDRIDVVVRLYGTRRSEAVSFRYGGALEDLPAIVDRLAIDIMTAVAGERDPLFRSIQRNATSSPDALKAYLAARSAMRRGEVDSAVAAIERAVAIDSTFALGWLESVYVHSWAQSMRGQAYAGMFERLERAEAHADSLNTRNRLRLAASRALVETDGRAAATALNRILEMDSTDLPAWAGLSFSHTVYGWQYGASVEDAVSAADRVVALDSTYLPGLVARAWIAVATADTLAIRQVAAALGAHGNEHVLGRSTLDAIRALAAPDSALPALAESLGRRGVGDWSSAYRFLRVESPDRAETLIRTVAALPDPEIAARASGELFRLDLARGRVRTAARELASGRYAGLANGLMGQRFVVAATLAAVGDTARAVEQVRALEAFVPHDSALAYFEERPVWWSGWLVGAWHAQFGDTTEARRWQRTLGSLPPGGTSPDYRGALQDDIEARLLARAGQIDQAIPLAERAMKRWGIHSELTFESLPPPLLRFHLGLLHKAVGDAGAARSMFRSLVPPSTWLGFLTARAWYELGVLAEEARRLDEAHRYYERALSLWEGGDPEIDPWRDPARRGLVRVLERK